MKDEILCTSWSLSDEGEGSELALMKTYRIKLMMRAIGRVIAPMRTRRRKENILLIGVTPLFRRREL